MSTNTTKDATQTKRVFRGFYDPLKEEAWLQDMADSGWILSKIGFGGYTFQKCPPNTYNIQLALCKNRKEKAAVEEMLTESGAVVIPVKNNPLSWIYAVREKSFGDFEINSTADSKARSDLLWLKWLRLYWIVALVCAALIAIFTPGILHGDETEWTDFLSGFATGLALSPLVVTLPVYLRIRKRLKSYRDDSGIYAS